MRFIKSSYFILLFLPLISHAQSVEVKNVYFEPKGDELFIYYDLQGNPQESYIIEVFLKTENDSKFNYKLVHVSGDIGEGKFVGIKKKIVWNIAHEFPIGLGGEDYYFEVTAEEIGEGIAWYYYVGAALVGGVAAVLITSDKSGDDSPTLRIPIPPIRPDN